MQWVFKCFSMEVKKSYTYLAGTIRAYLDSYWLHIWVLWRVEIKKYWMFCVITWHYVNTGNRSAGNTLATGARWVGAGLGHGVTCPLLARTRTDRISSSTWWATTWWIFCWTHATLNLLLVKNPCIPPPCDCCCASLHVVSVGGCGARACARRWWEHRASCCPGPQLLASTGMTHTTTDYQWK